MADICAENLPLVLINIESRLPQDVLLSKDLKDKMKIHSKESYGLRKAFTILIRLGFVKTLLIRFRDEAKRKMFTVYDQFFIRSYIVPILENLTDRVCGISHDLLIAEVQNKLKFDSTMINQIKNGTRNAYDCHMSIGNSGNNSSLNQRSRSNTSTVTNNLDLPLLEDTSVISPLDSK